MIGRRTAAATRGRAGRRPSPPPWNDAPGVSPSIAAIRSPAAAREWKIVVLTDGRMLRVRQDALAHPDIDVGRPVSPDLVQVWTELDAYYRARDTALRLLAIRARTVEELRARFLRDGVPASQARAVLDELAASGYVDDLAFARSWIAARLDRGAFGVSRLRAELRRRGVPTSVIEQAVRDAYGEEGTSVGEDRHAAALVARRERSYRALPPEIRRRRMARWLERRGFASATIARVIGMMKHAGRRPIEDE